MRRSGLSWQSLPTRRRSDSATACIGDRTVRTRPCRILSRPLPPSRAVRPAPVALRHSVHAQLFLPGLDGGARFTVDFAASHRLALVLLLFSFGQCEQYLDAAGLE